MKAKQVDRNTAMKKLLASLLILLVNPVFALDVNQNAAFAKLFDAAGVKGTFVLYDLSADSLVVHDLPRANRRYIPASTFKIANSLIGLSTGAVSSVDEVLPYGGAPQPFKSWEQDMGLKDAIKVSNVPVYQELARRIGLERMRDELAAIPYGNAETGDEVDTFWLKGPLQISAVEQARFLARLARDELPFPVETQRSVREIAKLEQGDGWVLYGKTGWTTAPEPDIGWWVGWLTRDSRVYSFALNIDMLDKSDIGKRIDLGKACLKQLGIF